MKLQFYRPVCWSVFLLCITFNAPADERSSTQTIDSEMATSPSEKRNLKRKPILTLTKSLQNHSEFEAESIGKKELRSNKHTAFDGIPLSKQNIKQNLALSSVKNENQKNQSSFAESKHTQNQSVRELESIAGSELRNGEQIALMKPLSPKLKIGREIVVPIASTENNEKLVFIEADLIQGHNELEVEGIGNAELRSDDQIITADRMKYFQETDDIEVEGNVRVEQQGDVIEGSRLKMNLESKTGQMDNPSYQLKDGSSRGGAKTILIEGEGLYRFRQARYTTCPEGNEDWIIEADDLEMDDNEKTGTVRGAKLKFLGMPIGYTPWGNFSYSGERKTGLLAPTYSTNKRTGFDVSIPFYWNIAPNYDATFKARAMSKRGIMVNNEFRYLTKNIKGNIIYDILPDDLESARDNGNQTRQRISFKHDQKLGKGWGRGWSTRLDYNRVSDDFFFRDLGKGLNATSRTNLLQQGLVAYNSSLGKDGTISFSTRAQKYQTIQDPVVTIVKPYKRLPQVLLEATQRNVLGAADLSFSGSWTDFSHPTLVDGKRYTLFPNVSVPLQNSFGYIKPKVGVHHTGYNLNRTTVPSKRNLNRTLPIVSLDSGVTFDRETELIGEQFTHTIEPRFNYVYIPYDNQSLLPVFDTAAMDFSFARIFTENRFSGSDRINDANRITMALTSRLLESDTGIERFRVTVGQQLNLEKRRVFLPPQPNVVLGTTLQPNRVLGNPDFIVALSGKITPTLSANTTMQFDQSKTRTEVIRSSVSYQPELGKVVNLGYRYTRGILKQTDISGQWSIAKRWQGVGRLNYSLRDNLILEGLAGIQYNACCWTARFVVQKLRTSTTRTNTTFYLQLELGGLLQIGSNPLRILQRSIPGYTNADGQVNQYDDLELR
jgi:LPS-assembly protein